MLYLKNNKLKMKITYLRQTWVIQIQKLPRSYMNMMSKLDIIISYVNILKIQRFYVISKCSSNS